MIQYYQLTPDILLEYVYENDSKLDDDGIEGNKKDICNENTTTMLLKSNAFSTKYLCFANETEGFDSISNLVLPLNNTETQFVIAKSKYQSFFDVYNPSNIYSSKNGNGYIYENTNYDSIIKQSNQPCEVKYDKCILHFTSKNYFGTYDSLIFQAYVYMKNKSKLYFASFLFEKTSNLEMKSELLLYNEKLYTKQIEFDIPSVLSIFAEVNKTVENKTPENEHLFVTALESQNVELLANTPIGFNVYGVSGSTKGVDNYVRLKTYKISSITVPCINNRLDEIHVEIKESNDGDYYEIAPKMGSGYTSFVEYIKRLGEVVQNYMIMHELKLKELWVDVDGKINSEITHTECHIISINEDDEDVEISKIFEKPIKYRPICIYGGKDCSAVIIDTIKIINLVDNSSYVSEGSLEITTPNKYGKKLKHLDVSRPIVNVYNKKVSDEKGTGNNAISLSRNGGFVVENNTQNITSFIECTNIGISILEISPEDIN